MTQNILNPCAVPQQDSVILDPPSPFCPDPCGGDSLRGGFEECGGADGVHGLCDPIQTGQIINDLEVPNRDVIYRYGKGLRGCDEAMLDMFKNVVVIDDDGKAYPVPIVWASQERAVAALLQENVRQDSTVVDRIKLPTMAIYPSSYNYNQEKFLYHRALEHVRDGDKSGVPGYLRNDPRASTTVYGLTRGIPIEISYKLYVWTMFIEDMNQIMEQIMTKFSPMAYIRIRGVRWEIVVKLDSIANNIDIEPGDKNLRVVKFEFGMTTQTFIPQPIVRKRTVLRTNIEFLDGLTEDDVIGVLSRIDESGE